MARSRGRIIHFGIFGVAAAALLAIFFLHESGQFTPVEQPVLSTSSGSDSRVEAPQPAADAVIPAPDEAEGASRANPDRSVASGGVPALRTERERSPYPGANVDQERIFALHGNRPLDKNHPHVAKVIEVQERHTDELLAHPAVVGTGVGLNDDGQIAILVFAKKEADGIPAVLQGHPVVVVQSGEVFARNRMVSQDAGTLQDDVSERSHATPYVYAERYDRPVPIGVSTGHVDITAGTIGCRVKDVNGALYALSNNHVYADENNAEIDDAVIQPGTVDHGVSPGDDIGTLFAFKNIVFDAFEVDENGDLILDGNGDPIPNPGATENKIDAAIAETTDQLLGVSTPSGGYGTPSASTDEPSLNMRVGKVGRTTGNTDGRIVAINVNVIVGYDSGFGLFTGQFVVDGLYFSQPGDSGSLIVKKKGKKPVGLLYAGAGAWTTIGNNINDVLAEFNVTVDDGSSGSGGGGGGGGGGGPPPGKGKNK